MRDGEGVKPAEPIRWAGDDLTRLREVVERLEERLAGLERAGMHAGMGVAGLAMMEHQNQRLRKMLWQAIETLRETQSAFRSKRLKDLRERMESVLREEGKVF